MKRILSIVMLLPFLGIFLGSCQTQSQPGGQMGGQMGGMSGGGPGGSMGGGAPGGQMERFEPDESAELLMRLESLLHEDDESIRLTQEQKSALVPQMETWVERMARDKKIRNRHIKRVKNILTDIQLICRVNVSGDRDNTSSEMEPLSSQELLIRVLKGCREGAL